MPYPDLRASRQTPELLVPDPGGPSGATVVQPPPTFAPGCPDSLSILGHACEPDPASGTSIETMPGGVLVARLIREMTDAWWRGEEPRAEDYLGRHPELSDDAAIRLVGAEVRLRRKAGLDVSAAELASRFPRWGDRLGALFEPSTFLPRVARVVDLPDVGDALGQYRLKAFLGRGVRGAVYLAEQSDLANRPVVLKVTPRDGREHLCLARLQHAHIVPLYAVHDLPERDLRLLCMPYLGGTTLACLLGTLGEIPIGQRSGRDVVGVLDQALAGAPVGVPHQGPARQFLARVSYVKAVCWIGACLADALQFAHERELLHLDLKPSNVLLAADGTPMLLDFHLAQAPLRPNEAVHRLGGTPSYMSPEQWSAMICAREGRPAASAVDGRSDIFSLGVMLYEALGGAIPSSFCLTLERQFQPPPHVPTGLADIVRKCLSFEPNDRYASAALLAEDLRRQLADLPLRGVANRSLGERWAKWRRRRPHALGRGLALALACAGLLVATAVVGADARRRLRGAEALLAEGGKQLEGRDYRAAAQSLGRGLALIDPDRGFPLGRYWPRTGVARRTLGEQLRVAQQALVADEFHRLADRVRLLEGTDLPASAGLQALERRLSAAWGICHRIKAHLETGLDPELAQRLRSDALDLAILWSDLRVRLAAREEVAARRRDALRTLREAGELFGPSPVLDRERRRHAGALGQAEAAATEPTPSRVPAPDTAWEHFALGRSLLADGELESAAAEFERATDLRPQDLWGYFYRGVCAYRGKRFEAAVHAFDVCVALAPRTAECYYNRARAHSALGHVGAALRDYGHALRLAPELAVASLNRGVLLYREGRYREAIDDFDRALAAGADPAVVRHNLVLARQAERDRSAAPSRRPSPPPLEAPRARVTAPPSRG